MLYSRILTWNKDPRNRLGDWHGQQQEQDGWTVELRTDATPHVCQLPSHFQHQTGEGCLLWTMDPHPCCTLKDSPVLWNPLEQTDPNLPGLLLSQISVPRLFPDTVTSLCSKHRLFCFLANRGGMRDCRTRALAGACDRNGAGVRLGGSPGLTRLERAAFCSVRFSSGNNTVRVQSPPLLLLPNIPPTTASSWLREPSCFGWRPL